MKRTLQKIYEKKQLYELSLMIINSLYDVFIRKKYQTLFRNVIIQKNNFQPKWPQATHLKVIFIVN